MLLSILYYFLQDTQESYTYTTPCVDLTQWLAAQLIVSPFLLNISCHEKHVMWHIGFFSTMPHVFSVTVVVFADFTEELNIFVVEKNH